jgi:glycopeptide antibiotics resistance protein
MPTPTTLARATWFAWTAFIVVLSLLPLGAVYSSDPAVWVAIVPLDSIGRALHRGLVWATIVSIAGNVVAFVPVGLLAPMGWERWRSWMATLALGVGISLGIELSQLAVSIAIGIPYRHADVDDVILNGLGTAIGYGAWTVLRRVVVRA